ncbi:MAG: hypothetical protein FWG81_05985 [Betaproteobacteria bacterium]|nr:hypothetical protein [Betaproteobacteria bacterium]
MRLFHEIFRLIRRSPHQKAGGFVVSGGLWGRVSRLVGQFCMMAAMSSLVMSHVSQAATLVSGDIEADANWEVEGSPYLISGDVILQGGAKLRIGPGVVIHMEPDAGFTLRSGSVRALGTAENPIHVLSSKSQSAAGDWKNWTLEAGTSSDTLLEHVIFEHGSGLVIHGSAPVFNYVQIREQAGAAITIDLAASVSGIGNSASANGINGILVPAGDITGNVKWGMQGIPYYVSSGVVSVGISPRVESITPEAIVQGETTIFQISGSRLLGLSEVAFNVEGLSAQILAGGTDSKASISVSADPDALAEAVDLALLVDAGEVYVPAAFAVVTTDYKPNLSFGESEISVSRGFRKSSTVSRDAKQDISEAVRVMLTSSDPDKASVSAVVTIPAGSKDVNFTVTGHELTEGEPVLIDANATGFNSPEARLRVNVESPEFTFSGLALNRFPDAPRDDFRVCISSQYAFEDFPVDLSIVEANPAGIVAGLYAAPSGDDPVASTLIRAGNSCSDPGYVGAPVSVGSYKIRVSGTNIEPSVSALVTVRNELRELKFNMPYYVLGKGLSSPNNALSVSRYSNGNVYSEDQPLTVQLTSSNPGKVRVPATVTIPAGSSSVTFSMDGIDLTAHGERITVDAVAAGFESPTLKIAAYVVEPPTGSMVHGGVEGGTLSGGSGADVLVSGPGANLLQGAAGNDTYIFLKGDGQNTIYDGSGSDTIRFMDVKSDEIKLIKAGNGYDLQILYGESSSVTVQSHFYSSSYRMAKYEFSDGVSLTNAELFAQHPVYLPEGVNNSVSFPSDFSGTIMGSSGGNDTIRGGNGGVTIYGVAGNNALSGGNGDDILISGTGNDSLSGGSGNDTLICGLGNSTMQGGLGNDTYVFSKGCGQSTISDYQGSDTIRFMDVKSDEIVVMKVGNDLRILYGESSSVTVYYHFSNSNYRMVKYEFADGVSLTNAELFAQHPVYLPEGVNNSVSFPSDFSGTIMGSSGGNDTIRGGNGGVTIYGVAGNNALSGGNGDDILISGTGNDSLSGGSGNDTLICGLGNSTMQGGLGNDTYVFSKGCGQSTISDYQGSDTIRFMDVKSDEIVVMKVGNDLRILYGESGSVTVYYHFSNSNYRMVKYEFADGVVLLAADLLHIPFVAGVGYRPIDYILLGTGGGE